MGYRTFLTAILWLCGTVIAEVGVTFRGSAASAALVNMKYVKLFGLLSTALFVAACDNDGTEVVQGEIATIDFFDMEVANTETIPFEPALGFGLPARGPLTINSSVIGSTTNGTDYRYDCAPGQVLVGIEGFETGNRVNQVSALCAGVDNNGNWTSTAQRQGEQAGISSGNPFNLSCAAGTGVTGITGVTTNDAVSYLQLHCRQLLNATTTVGVEQDTATVGQYNWAYANRLCGTGGVATGIHGKVNNDLRAFGVVCNESPATAGRWSNPVAWPVQAVHAIMTPQGDVMSYGFREGSGNIFDYDVWNPELGYTDASHNTFASSVGVFSFCNASIVMPSNGNILLPGGTKLNSDNAGVVDVPVYNTQTGGLSRAPDMAYPRWYPTAISMPNSEILVAGGRDVAGVAINTPEIYSPETNQWRSLFGANMLGLEWTYPRLWVTTDGRVFGVSNNQMYYINTEGSGALQRVGTLPNNHFFGAESTAVMYAPGKILLAGSNQSGGLAALTIDITSGSPQVKETNNMRLPRSAWANATVMADGRVMVVGGSRLVNDAPTAALNAEIWDPETEVWTVVSGLQWPRLYHSNSVLLKDATVLISGGGNPGPVTNYNAETFSPPYLFDAQGGPASRPEITWAPENGTYGQTISLNTSEKISRVTMVKTTSVTHSFNNEQRFIDLPLSGSTNNSVNVTLPGNDATPGYYMIFAFNEQGTPSEAVILNMGDEAAEQPPAPVAPTPEPADTEVNNLLTNGGFEQDKANWQDCSDPATSAISNNASHGQNALIQQAGACLFQEFVVEPNTSYTVTCEAAAQNDSYSSISMNTLDQDYSELSLESSVVSGNSFTPYSVSLTAPANAAFAAVTLYSEGPTRYDSCVVTAGATTQPVAPPATAPVATQPVTPPVTAPAAPPADIPATNLLSNGDFAQDKADWLDCSSAQLTQVVDSADASGKVLQVSDAGCIYQEFQVTTGKEYRMQCIAQSEGTQYSSISFQMSDASFNAIDADVNVVGPGAFTTYTSTLAAPANTATSVVTIYSEDIARIEACYVEEI